MTVYENLKKEGLISDDIEKEEFDDFMDEIMGMIEDGSGLSEVEDFCLDMGMDLDVIERILLG